MARLILGPKTFAAVMRSLHGYRNMKINRTIEQTLKRQSNLVINLDANSRNEISDAIAGTMVSNHIESPFNDAYALAHDPANAEASVDSVAAEKGNLAIQYTIEEWKALVIEHSLSGESQLDPRKMWGVHSINMELTPYREVLDPVFTRLLAKGARRAPVAQ